LHHVADGQARIRLRHQIQHPDVVPLVLHGGSHVSQAQRHGQEIDLFRIGGNEKDAHVSSTANDARRRSDG